MELIDIQKIINTNICIHKEDKQEYLRLKNSIQLYGQLRPIILTKNNEIIHGHKLFKACLDLKFEEVWIKYLDIINKEQVYCELNFYKNEIDPISFFKYVRDHIDIKNNNLYFSAEDLKGFINLLSFNWEDFNKKSKKSLF